MKRFLCIACSLALLPATLWGLGVRALSATDDAAQTADLPAVQLPAQEENLLGEFLREEAAPAEQTVPSPAPAATEQTASPAPAAAASPEVNDEYLSPLVTLRADHYLYKYEGRYYFTGSYPEYDRIELTSADSVNGIAAAVPKTIWKMDGATMSKYVWAPEIHYVMGQWVIYFAYSQTSLWDIKACALRCKGDDPMHDEWEYMGMIKAAEGDNFFNNSGMTLDMTVFYHEALGKWYAIWAQKPSSSNLYIAEMETPFAFASKSILLSQPDYDWEKVRENVNEGPAVLQHAGKIFVSFSAAATGFEYCMGLLELDACDDPMEIGNWTKYKDPVFKTDESLKIYGPGHNCFVEGDNGEQLCILHFRDYKDITGDSLLDYNRHAHVMKITYDKNGVPQFHLGQDELYNAQFQDHGKS